MGKIKHNARDLAFCMKAQDKFNNQMERVETIKQTMLEVSPSVRDFLIKRTANLQAMEIFDVDRILDEWNNDKEKCIKMCEDMLKTAAQVSGVLLGIEEVLSKLKRY